MRSVDLYGIVIFLFTEWIHIQPAPMPHRDSTVPAAASIVDEELLNRKTKRHAVYNPDNLWTNRVIPYDASTMNKVKLDVLLEALEEIENSSGGCIDFQPQVNQNDYIQFKNHHDGLYNSKIGRQGRSQVIHIGLNKEADKGLIMHEVMHALGFYHEHTRSDRDHYVQIHWDNIEPWHEKEFRMEAVSNLDLPYDYSSIMHYKSDTFSKHSGEDTITPLDNAVDKSDLGQREALSTLDIRKLKRLYRCDLLFCEKPGLLDNGHREGVERNIGALTTYTCCDRYQLIGATERTCTINSGWSGATPFCVPSGFHYCSFDSEYICGWVQDTNDDRNWTRHNGTTGTKGTGPIVDHTIAKSTGFYMYMEGTGGKKGQIARLISTPFPSKDNICLLFYCYLNGPNIGKLTVKLGDQILVEVIGHQGEEWKRVALRLDFVTSTEENFQIMFEATRGNGAKSDIAIDDVMVGDCTYVQNYMTAEDEEDGVQSVDELISSPKDDS